MGCTAKKLQRIRIQDFEIYMYMNADQEQFFLLLHIVASSVVKWIPVRCESDCRLLSNVSVCKMAPGWEASQGVANVHVHTFCAGNPIIGVLSIKRLEKFRMY